MLRGADLKWTNCLYPRRHQWDANRFNELAISKRSLVCPLKFTVVLSQPNHFNVYCKCYVRALSWIPVLLRTVYAKLMVYEAYFCVFLLIHTESHIEFHRDLETCLCNRHAYHHYINIRITSACVGESRIKKLENFTWINMRHVCRKRPDRCPNINTLYHRWKNLWRKMHRIRSSTILKVRGPESSLSTI